MVFSWLNPRTREEIVAEPFPEEWLTYLGRNLFHYRFLSEEEQAKLRDDLRIFIAEKNWEGCGGLKMTDEIKVIVAAQACLLLLGMEHDYFSRVKSILVYPDWYRAPSGPDGTTGFLFDGGQVRAGEAHYRGPVVLSWRAVRAGGRRRHGGFNLVFHEFAHQLDMLDGEVNGTPPLENAEQAQRWHEVMTREFERLIEQSELGHETLLDDYGATDEAEFFAVATECFFQQPVEMAEEYPELYELLRGYYRQDPAKWFAGRNTEHRG